MYTTQTAVNNGMHNNNNNNNNKHNGKASSAQTAATPALTPVTCTELLLSASSLMAFRSLAHRCLHLPPPTSIHSSFHILIAFCIYRPPIPPVGKTAPAYRDTHTKTHTQRHTHTHKHSDI